jgi:hypothetical protein
MPRKTRVYWIHNPVEPTKCHSRRCVDLAVRNRLCAQHYTAWKLAGSQPAMPDYDRSGVVKASEPPLKMRLDEDIRTYRQFENELAMLPSDDSETLDTLHAAVQELDKNMADLRRRHEAAREPFEKGLKRVDGWFAKAETELERAKKQSSDKIVAVRTTMRAAMPPPPTGEPSRRDSAADAQLRYALRGGRG